MALQDILASLLNPNGVWDLGGPENRARLAREGSPLVASMAQPQAAQQGVSPVQVGDAPPQAANAPVAAPAPASQPSQGNGVSGFLTGLQGLFNPQARGRNMTIDWLTQQGYDPGTAQVIASDKSALRSVILGRGQGKASEFDQRAQAARQYGINPNSPEGRAFILTGKWGDDEKSSLINAGAGNIYDPKTGKWIIAPNSGNEKLPAAVQEYEYARSQGFPGTFQDWEASKKGGMSLSVDPETGAVTFQQGGNIKPMSEGQSKDTTFATRAEGALGVLDAPIDPNNPRSPPLSDALISLPQSIGGQVPVVGNYAKSPEYQRAEQAGTEFLQAILRKDTGAAITPQETAEYGKVYLPLPGDSPAVLQQKRLSRSRALEALKAGMTPQAILAQEKALGKVGTGTAAPGQPAEQPSFSNNQEVFDAIANGQVKVGDTIILNGKKMKVEP